MIDWEILDTSSKLELANTSSYKQDVLIFKHSTTCSISHMAKMRLEDGWDSEFKIIPFFLDLKSFRQISDDISEKFSVNHESPQVLLIRKGSCIYDASHFDITINELNETLAYHAG